MDENNDKHISSDECTDSEPNWICKICKDLPQYAEKYLMQRECVKSKAQIEEYQRADIIHIRYFYALLHLLDEIHKYPACLDLQRPTSESTYKKCPTPEHFDRYRKMYNTYAAILISESGVASINLKCDICAVLPHTLFIDLDMVAKNMHIDDIEKMQKLELDEMVTDCYMKAIGSCEQWDGCPNGANWLDLRYSVQTLKKYLETKDRKELHISLSSWNRVRSTDNLLDAGCITSSRDFDAQHISLRLLAGKKLVYLDFGVYQLYENNESFRTRLDTYAEMDNIQFIYSPAHMEEVCRMGDSAFESKRRENISKISGDHEVLPAQGGYIKVVTEPVDVCFARAKKLQNLNRNAEEYECAKFEALEERTCSLLKWSEKEMEERRKRISALNSIQLFDPKNEIIDNNSLNRVFCVICGSQVPLEDLKGYCKKKRTFPEIREAIQQLYLLMNALGYHRNKIEKRSKFTHMAFYPTYDREFYRTIRSGFYDVDHLCYATQCDYFVTCDYALSLQAKEIYRYLGCETRIIYCEKKETDPSLPLAILCGEPDTQ